MEDEEERRPSVRTIRPAERGILTPKSRCANEGSISRGGSSSEEIESISARSDYVWLAGRLDSNGGRSWQ